MGKEKLVRDMIPAMLTAKGIPCRHRVARHKEIPGLLRDKLLEEVIEYMEEPSLEELADVLEVMYALARLHGFTPAALEAIRSKKAREKGAFTEYFVMKIED